MRDGAAGRALCAGETPLHFRRCAHLRVGPSTLKPAVRRRVSGHHTPTRRARCRQAPRAYLITDAARSAISARIAKYFSRLRPQPSFVYFQSTGRHYCKAPSQHICERRANFSESRISHDARLASLRRRRYYATPPCSLLERCVISHGDDVFAFSFTTMPQQESSVSPSTRDR